MNWPVAQVAQALKVALQVDGEVYSYFTANEQLGVRLALRLYPARQRVELHISGTPRYAAHLLDDRQAGQIVLTDVRSVEVHFREGWVKFSTGAEPPTYLLVGRRALWALSIGTAPEAA